MTEALVDDFLAHYGVKGMRWGIRRPDPSNSGPPPAVGAPGVTVRSDGSIDIQKGASLQRLVRSNGKSMPLQGMTYASMLEYDNARYIKTIGANGLLSFGQGRDQILGLQATKKITAPSKEEATRMVSEMMVSNPEFRKRNTVMFGGPISDKDLKTLKDDPTGKFATSWYEMTNAKMTLSGDFDPDAPFMQQMLKAEVLKRGHNALRDENDVSGKLAKAPIMIFNPESTLKVTTVTSITDDLRKANKAKLQEYKSQGKGWVDQQLYG
jgi:hypothetical protein